MISGTQARNSFIGPRLSGDQHQGVRVKGHRVWVRGLEGELHSAGHTSYWKRPMATANMDTHTTVKVATEQWVLRLYENTLFSIPSVSYPI